MGNNIKGPDGIESKAESIDLKEGRGLKIEPEDLAKKPKGVSASGTLMSSGENEKEVSKSSESKLKILVVDDDENIRDVLEDFLNLEGHKPVLAKDGKEALNIFFEQDFDMVLSDLGMPGMSGWELTKHVKQRKPEIPVVIITGWGAQLTDEELKQNKTELILSKPFHLDQVKQVIETVRAKFLKKETRYEKFNSKSPKK